MMKRTADVCMILISAALLLILFARLRYSDLPIDFSKMEFTDFEAREIAVPLPTYNIFPSPTPTPKPARITVYYQNIFKPYYLDDVVITGASLNLTYLGNYYITAYCPSECGYNGSNYPTGWRTASDIICHRASYENRYTEPTTCAVDPRLHRIGKNGDLFYLPYFDRVFKAEDTGSAVKGKHLDLFYEEYSDVCSFPTNFYSTYSVEVEEYTVRAGDYDVRNIIQKKFIEKAAENQ